MRSLDGAVRLLSLADLNIPVLPLLQALSLLGSSLKRAVLNQLFGAVYTFTGFGIDLTYRSLLFDGLKGVGVTRESSTSQRCSSSSNALFTAANCAAKRPCLLISFGSTIKTRSQALNACQAR